MAEPRKKIPKRPEYQKQSKKEKERVERQYEEEYEEEQRPNAEYIPGSDEVSFSFIVIFFFGV